MSQRPTGLRHGTSREDQAVGVSQVERDMRLAEQRHSRGRRAAMVAVGLCAVGLALFVGGVAVFGGPAKPAAPRPTVAAAVPAPAAEMPATAPATAQPATAAPAAPAAVAVPVAKPAAPKAAPAAARKKPAAATTAPKSQLYRIAIGGSGYQPSRLTASSGSAISLTVAKGDGCAAGFLMPQLGISADNSSGPVTVRLGRLKPGVYRFTCGMEMVEGQLTVR